MRRKIIENYRLLYLNDLFGIKWSFCDPSRTLQLSEFVWSMVLVVLTIISWKTQQIEVKCDLAVSLYPPFHSSRTKCYAFWSLKHKMRVVSIFNTPFSIKESWHVLTFGPRKKYCIGYKIWNQTLGVLWLWKGFC